MYFATVDLDETPSSELREHARDRFDPKAQVARYVVADHPHAETSAGEAELPISSGKAPEERGNALFRGESTEPKHESEVTRNLPAQHLQKMRLQSGQA